MRKTAVVIAAMVLCTITGCSGHADTESERPSASPTDPMVQLRDKAHDFYTDATPVLHEHGTGSTTFTVRDLPAGTTRITYYVSCSPSSRYSVTMGKRFTGPCDQTVANSGGIPTSGAAREEVSIKLPKGTAFWLVGIPEQD